jgi:hypothetical protein
MMVQQLLVNRFIQFSSPGDQCHMLHYGAWLYLQPANKLPAESMLINTAVIKN